MPGTPASSAIVIAAGLVAVAAAPSTVAARPSDVTIRAADGVAVHGTYTPAPRPRALILLFHQAGSGKGEYATIAPRLAAAGYASLAIDQRSGGSMFGPNKTVAGLGRSASYLDAERDLEAAFAWGRRRGPPVVLWGSSYSAALVLRLAARHPREVSAVLAFSPGEYLGAPALVRQAASGVRAPVFATSSAAGAEIAAARAILAASPAAFKVQHLPSGAGVHGSSTLIRARNPRGAADNWRAVLAFLDRVV